MRRYWEQVRDEMADILDEDVARRCEAKSFEVARQEAVERLYVRGIFQELAW